MNIMEATKIALKKKAAITRTHSKTSGLVKIYPTMSSDCCILCISGEKMKIRRCWNPTADDLMADDWGIIQ